MRKSNILILNGPNMNMLGIREKSHYGEKTWSDIEDDIRNTFSVELTVYQSNHMGMIVDFIQAHYGKIDGIVINPSSFTTTGYPILDAINAINVPFVEVHMTNVFSRGGWHANSIFFEKAIGVIVGFKESVYSLAVQALDNYLTNEK